MGKYIIRVESVERDEAFDKRYAEGIECDGFAILADRGTGCCVAIHQMNVDGISDIITGNGEMLSAAILAKAKVDIGEASKKSRMKDMLGSLLGLDD